ncbi:MAG TPA: hypothetical protein VMF56_04505 [Acidobacteriaceae bacterium]|nr:hypothetical protein [Acidobacteriaceae bacterium]
MENLDSEYPTDEQMKEMWEALESGDDNAVLAILKKRKAERKAAQDIPEGNRANSQNAGDTNEAANTVRKRQEWKN